MTSLCAKCKRSVGCRMADIHISGCSRFKRDELPLNNEEWLNSLNTADKAHFLSVEAARAISEFNNRETKRTGVDFWNLWLKAVHRESE